jgi:hypothetical protein
MLSKGITENDKILEGVQIVKDDDKIKYVYQKPQVNESFEIKSRIVVILNIKKCLINL